MIGLLNAFLTGKVSSQISPQTTTDGTAVSADHTKEDTAFLLMLSQIIGAPAVQHQGLGESATSVILTSCEPATTRVSESEGHAGVRSVATAADITVDQVMKLDEAKTLPLNIDSSETLDEGPLAKAERYASPNVVRNSIGQNSAESIVDNIIDWRTGRVEEAHLNANTQKSQVSPVDGGERILVSGGQKTPEPLRTSASQLIHEAVASQKSVSGGAETAIALKEIVNKFSSVIAQPILESSPAISRNVKELNLQPTDSVVLGTIVERPEPVATPAFVDSRSIGFDEPTRPQVGSLALERIDEHSAEGAAPTASEFSSRKVAITETTNTAQTDLQERNTKDGSGAVANVSTQEVKEKNTSEPKGEASLRVDLPRLTESAKREPSDVTVSDAKMKSEPLSHENVGSEGDAQFAFKRQSASTTEDGSVVPEVKQSSHLELTSLSLPDEIPVVDELQNQPPSVTVVFDVKTLLKPPAVATKQPVGSFVAQSAHATIPEDFGRALVVRISEELKAHIEGKSSEVKVVMRPESMGDLSLRVSMEQGRVVANLDVSQPAVKSALEAQLPQLREALASQGIDVQRFDITSGNENQFRRSFAGGTSHHHPDTERNAEVDGTEALDEDRRFGYNTVEYII